MMSKNRTTVKTAAALIAAGALTFSVFGMSGCSSEPVAATVNGEALPESTVTDYIAQFRQSNSLTDDTAWAQWMVDNSYDASSIRDTAIDYYVRQMVIAQDAKSHNVSVSDDEVNNQVDEIRANYNLDDQGWIDQLESVGYTEDTYRDYVKNSLLSEKLEEAVITDVDVSDDEVLETANMYATYIDGAADVSVIVMSLDNQDNANELASQIKSGAISFDDAKSQNSTTDEYDGVDTIVGLESTVTDQIANMAKDDISDPIVGQNNIYIVRVNDIIDAPDGDSGWASVSDLPQGVYNTFYDQVYSTNRYSEFDTYVQNLVDNADVQKNDMPSDAPYNVSTDGLTPSSETSGDTTATTDAESTTDESTGEASTESTDAATTDDAAEQSGSETAANDETATQEGDATTTTE